MPRTHVLPVLQDALDKSIPQMARIHIYNRNGNRQGPHNTLQNMCCNSVNIVILQKRLCYEVTIPCVVVWVQRWGLGATGSSCAPSYCIYERG